MVSWTCNLIVNFWCLTCVLWAGVLKDTCVALPPFPVEKTKATTCVLPTSQSCPGLDKPPIFCLFVCFILNCPSSVKTGLSAPCQTRLEQVSPTVHVPCRDDEYAVSSLCFWVRSCGLAQNPLQLGEGDSVGEVKFLQFLMAAKLLSTLYLSSTALPPGVASAPDTKVAVTALVLNRCSCVDWGLHVLHLGD